MNHRYVLIAALALALAGSMPPASAQTPTEPLEIARLELAQTHVLPEAGLSWTLANASQRLRNVGGRGALALLSLSATDAVNITLEGWANGRALGTVAVAPPAALPPTESGGPGYASDAYSAKIPASWMRPGLELRARADNYLAGAARTPAIGANTTAMLRVLPFYLYGATPANSFPLSSVGLPDRSVLNEIYAKWPVARLSAQNHPAQALVWPTLSIPPRNGNTAYLARSASDQRDGFDSMAVALQVMAGLIDANGERPLSVQYYAPLVMFDAQGRYHGAGGGLGGGEVGAGDFDYSGVFIHEQGHAMGAPHQGEAFDNGRYPYPGGSLSGSVWGFDQIGNRFLGTFVPASASSIGDCSAQPAWRQRDRQGRCAKQDPMQGGHGDQAAGYRFATFSDYTTATFQHYFESGLVADPAFAGGYRRWDPDGLRWSAYQPQTRDNGLWGFDDGLAQTRGVPVHAVVVSYSRAGTPEVSQIYPPLSYVGNLQRYIDPSDAAQRASIVPNVSENAWYCSGSGCDFTVRATYVDGSQRHVLVHGGFRSWFRPTAEPAVSTRDPYSGDSFRTWVVQVPGEKALSRIELLETPMAWEGLPATPKVLLSREVAAAAGASRTGARPAAARLQYTVER